jgi:PhnB protein
MQNAKIEPYIFFGGRCEEALEFYKNAIGAQVLFMMRFKESPTPHPEGMLPADYGEKIMHATVRIGASTIMASDGGCNETSGPQGFSLSLEVQTEEEVDRAFHALAEGGQVNMPPTQTFWSKRFGMLKDQFGLGWMVTVPAPLESLNR